MIMRNRCISYFSVDVKGPWPRKPMGERIDFSRLNKKTSWQEGLPESGNLRAHILIHNPEPKSESGLKVTRMKSL